MYQHHFNFTGPPFSIAPNPRYVYLSPQHREALAHLLYGISLGGGFIVLTGEVGTGKTTLCRCLMEQLPQDVDIALIFNPRLNARELLASLCDELHIAHPGDKTSIKRLIDRLNHHLLETHAQGRRTIVLIDEAQNLSFDVLEQIRLLTNLETNVAKLLQIILVGQPELKSLLARPNLRQLSQRITARYHLLPLSWAETEAYIAHRLAVSGISHRVFSRLAVFRIFRLSAGIPRLINLICDRALLGAYTLGKFNVGYAIAGKAAREVLPEQSQAAPSRAVLALLALSLLAAGGYGYRAGWLPASKALVEAAAPARPIKPESPANLPPQPQTGIIPTLPPEPKPSPQAGTSVMTAADFARRIADPALTRSLAFSRLYAAWGFKAPPGEYDGCRLAKRQGLRCLSAYGDGALLARLDRPAVLEFALPDGSIRHAALLGLEGETWVLELGESRLRVEGLPQWQGRFTLLWQPPAEASSQTGQARWLRSQLNEPAEAGKEGLFDAGLKQRIKDFQREQGLPADGRIGPVTLIQLENASPRRAGPSLSKTPD